MKIRGCLVRNYRKKEHVENYLRATYESDPLFKDIYLTHDSLPELGLDDIDTKTQFLDRDIPFPLMIDAMTGGTSFTEDINHDLSLIAKEHKLPMAVGSQTIALTDDDGKKSFEVVRQMVGDDGVVIANLSGFLTPDDAKYAVDMIGANGLQIHLNPAHELAMDEGDRDFKGIKKNIEAVVKALEVPVIVKEVGFGLSPAVIKELYNLGVRHVDIAGHGGTNFVEVENLRCPSTDMSDLYEWGTPTALATIQAAELELEDMTIISSGGIKTALDLAKALLIGADMTAISGELLKYLMHGGKEYASDYVASLITKTKMIMLLTGSQNLEELRKQPWTATGRLYELLNH